MELCKQIFGLKDKVDKPGTIKKVNDTEYEIQENGSWKRKTTKKLNKHERRKQKTV